MKRSRMMAAGLLTLCASALLPLRGHAAGEVNWFSLLTENQYVAIDFYSDLFGWEITDSPTGGFMAMRNGVPFAGISQIEDRVPGASESMWLAAITVADLDQSVATAKQLGATVYEEISDLPGWGRFALIADPQGAPVSLVAPVRPLGGTQGYSGWRWAELWTHDTEEAEEFYTKVIGYELEDVEVGAEHYSVFALDGKRDAGLVHLEQPEIAPRWAPYVGVSDLRAILVRVWQLGGKVLREPAEITSEVAGAKRVALIADPTGGALFLYQLDERATVDPAIAAQNQERGPRSAPSRTTRGGNPNVRVTVQYSYGFGGGWAGAYPRYPYGPYGPVPY
jgi:predicted enzyme related to lactoylglutathione lyase